MANTEIERRQRRNPHARLRIAVLFLVGIAALLARRWHTALVLPLYSGTVSQMSSQDWARIPIPQNNCSLINNVWNKAAADNEVCEGGGIVEIRDFSLSFQQ
jgi:hypothetical protein